LCFDAGLTASLAKEFASRHITVNCVQPGFIDTPMTAALSDAQRQEAAKRILSGKFGNPQDVAHAVAFLASPAAHYITGQNISVDGGMRF
jgi:3-oxoacyl-[acyl-carrier protein] reductase